MKVIDLLNKIANGEAPETIFYMGATYDYDEECMDYEDVDTGDLFFDDRYNTQILNDEVEIIEEPKEIEKLENFEITDTTISGLVKSLNVLHEDYANKINTVIDYLNQKENEK